MRAKRSVPSAMRLGLLIILVIGLAGAGIIGVNGLYRAVEFHRDAFVGVRKLEFIGSELRRAVTSATQGRSDPQYAQGTIDELRHLGREELRDLDFPHASHHGVQEIQAAFSDLEVGAGHVLSLLRSGSVEAARRWDSGPVQRAFDALGAARENVEVALRAADARERRRAMLGSTVLLLVALASMLAILSVFRRMRRKEFEHRLAREAERRFQALIQNVQDVIVLSTAEGVVTYISPACERLYGIPAQDIIGTNGGTAIHPDDHPRLIEMLTALGPGEAGSLEFRVRHCDGTWRHTETLSVNLLGDPLVQAFVSVSRDITQRKELEGLLRYKSFHDELTGLANRALLIDRGQQVISRTRRGDGSAALLFLDLDDFKSVNDLLGHDVGDMVLREVADRLRKLVRPGDTVARFGGDEFAILLEHATTSEAAAVAARVTRSLGEPFRVGKHTASIGVSVGVASTRPSEADVDDLLRDADLAMYHAKASGTNLIQVSDEAFRESMGIRQGLEADLKTALQRDELRLYYQPVVDMRNGTVVGVEALMRWQHPERGLLGAHEFIPIAEETGLVIPLGRWAIFEVARQAAEFSQRLGRGRCSVGVNVSARQLFDSAIVDDVREACRLANIDPALLLLEITETSLIDDAGIAASTLVSLKELGVQIAIDDFGTGYSSLAYLQQLPIDVIKVDRKFVAAVEEGPEGSAVAKAILMLARTLGAETIAEGIERPSQAATLQRMGCFTGQGFLYSRAIPATDLVKILSRSQPFDAIAERAKVALLVEDDEKLRATFARVLSGAGFEVLEVSTGEQAIEVTCEREVDVVVLDIGLPGVDGYEVCRQIQTRSKAKTAPVIIVSGNAQGPESRARGFEAGADRYLLKPLSPKELASNVMAAMRTKLADLRGPVA